MAVKIIVVGAGVIGAATAWNLARSGAQVTVVDAGLPAATAASFGWINASFFLNEDHFRLRVEGISAYHRMAKHLNLPIAWSGCLLWEGTQEELDAQGAALSDLGYRVEKVDADRFTQMEPHVANPPEHALFLPDEAAAEPGALAARLLNAAQVEGARVIRGIAVQGVLQTDNQITGVRTDMGEISADHVVLCTGVATANLLNTLDISLPMLHRPALVIKTHAVDPVLNHILVSDVGEVRQLPDGSLMLPAAVGHQSDDADAPPNDLEAAAQDMLARLQAMLPDIPLILSETMLARRPMPQDGLPAVGQVAPGLYAATMHSGITLAAVMGELISSEVIQGETNHSSAWLTPYRPGRFS